MKAYETRRIAAQAQYNAVMQQVIKARDAGKCNYNTSFEIGAVYEEVAEMLARADTMSIAKLEREK